MWYSVFCECFPTPSFSFPSSSLGRVYFQRPYLDRELTSLLPLDFFSRFPCVYQQKPSRHPSSSPQKTTRRICRLRQLLLPQLDFPPRLPFPLSSRARLRLHRLLRYERRSHSTHLFQPQAPQPRSTLSSPNPLLLPRPQPRLPYPSLSDRLFFCIKWIQRRFTYGITFAFGRDGLARLGRGRGGRRLGIEERKGERWTTWRRTCYE